MLTPERAPVRPRVLTPGNGTALPLEDEVQALAAAGTRGVVYVAGPIGSGKTTALRHLAAVLPAELPVRVAAESEPDAGHDVADRAGPTREPPVAAGRLGSPGPAPASPPLGRRPRGAGPQRVPECPVN